MPNTCIVGCVEGLRRCQKGILFHCAKRKKNCCTTWVSVCVNVPFIISTQWLSLSVPPISWAFVWPVCLRGYKKVGTNMKSRCDEQRGTFNFKPLFGYSTNILFDSKASENNNIWHSNHRKGQPLLCYVHHTRIDHCIEVGYKSETRAYKNSFSIESKPITAEVPCTHHIKRWAFQ